MAKYKIIPSSRTIVQSPISIGHKAEKGVEAIEFDLTAWVETYGSGTLTVIMRRWGDAIPYPIALEIDENNKATWTLSDIDTAKAGMAYAQLSYVVGDTVVKKSDIYTFRVMDSLTGEGDPPEAYESWLEHLTHFAAEAMAEVLDIEGIVTDKTLTIDGGIADAKATGEALAEKVDAADYRELSNRVGANTIALAEKADQSTTYTKTEVDQMIEDVEVETDTTLSVSGAPADAAETGRQFGLIKADLSESVGDLKSALNNSLANESNFILEEGLINEYGIAQPSTMYCRTSNFTFVSAGSCISFSPASKRYRVWIYLYANSNASSFIEVTKYNDSIPNTNGYLYYVPYDCYIKFRVCIVPQETMTSAYISELAGAISCFTQKYMNKAKLIVCPEDYGAKGDGVTNDTIAIQKALDTGRTVLFRNGAVYLVARDNQNVILTVPSNTIVDLNGATIQLAPTDTMAYQIFMCRNTNITIKNGTVIGDRLVHIGEGGEYGHCIHITGTNITIENMAIKQGWGDGIYIGKSENTFAENIRVIGCSINDNRRNGMSITACKSCIVLDCEMNNNAGTAPQAGFDIEPNEDDIINIFMDNIVCKDNGDSPFCIANRYSSNCNVKVGSITTYGKGAHIRCTTKTEIGINTLHHYASNPMHLTANENVNINIENLYMQGITSNVRALYTDGVQHCRIGNFNIIGDNMNGLINNTSEAHLNIGTFSYGPFNSGTSISNTDVNILSCETKKETITANNDTKYFVNEIVFDEDTESSIIANVRNYRCPNKFKIFAYNPSEHICYINCGAVIVNSEESEQMPVSPGGYVEIEYIKILGKWFGKTIQ